MENLSKPKIILAWFGGLLLITLIIFGVTSKNNSSSSSSDLKITTLATSNGIAITNQEHSDWKDCMVGLNGDTGLHFDDPPFQTRGTLLNINAGKNITVPYHLITDQNGLPFDYTTHRINTLVVDCFRGSLQERSWVGTNTNQN